MHKDDLTEIYGDDSNFLGASLELDEGNVHIHTYNSSVIEKTKTDKKTNETTSKQSFSKNAYANFEKNGYRQY
jgi:hypothetical protein